MPLIGSRRQLELILCKFEHLVNACVMNHMASILVHCLTTMLWLVESSLSHRRPKVSSAANSSQTAWASTLSTKSTKRSATHSRTTCRPPATSAFKAWWRRKNWGPKGVVQTMRDISRLAVLYWPISSIKALGGLRRPPRKMLCRGTLTGLSSKRRRCSSRCKTNIRWAITQRISSIHW